MKRCQRTNVLADVEAFAAEEEVDRAALGRRVPQSDREAHEENIRPSVTTSCTTSEESVDVPHQHPLDEAPISGAITRIARMSAIGAGMPVDPQLPVHERHEHADGALGEVEDARGRVGDDDAGGRDRVDRAERDADDERRDDAVERDRAAGPRLDDDDDQEATAPTISADRCLLAFTAAPLWSTAPGRVTTARTRRNVYVWSSWMVVTFLLSQLSVPFSFGKTRTYLPPLTCMVMKQPLASCHRRRCGRASLAADLGREVVDLRRLLEEAGPGQAVVAVGVDDVVDDVTEEEARRQRLRGEAVGLALPTDVFTNASPPCSASPPRAGRRRVTYGPRRRRRLR